MGIHFSGNRLKSLVQATPTVLPGRHLVLNVLYNTKLSQMAFGMISQAHTSVLLISHCLTKTNASNAM